uniref:Endonuclease/exonuclease/phosphatase domain-containing protein n=1 Tax=Tetradesmus obliquus TaxID=3088 RepID=A0A383VFS8_TETOB|eukprot:jgi/Sobl393_1/16233/SZX64041.1
MVTVNAGPAAEVSVVTFNIRGIMDRWPERAPLLRRCLKQADADVFCFQEVLTGEFEQELQLLGPDYHVHECRAALQHLSASSLLGAAYVSSIRALLRFSWTRSLLVSLPESVEGWREQHQLAGNWSRLLRDLAIAPFYGNSIATRLPAAQLQPPQSSNQQSSSSSSSSKAAGLAGSIAGCCSSASSSGGWGTSSWGSSWGGSSSKAAAAAADLLVLGDFRAAQRVCVQLRLSPAPGTAPQQQQQQQFDGSGSAVEHGSSSSSSSEVAYVWLVNTHLDHAAADIRKRQAQAICGWMEPLKGSCAGIVMTGDLNAPPDEALHAAMAEAGFLSAHKAAHGFEPSHTWPSGIQAPLMDEGEPHCADYVYAWQAPGYQLLVTAAQLCGDQPSEQDATLYPSDHIGIKVKLRVVASSSSSGGGSAAQGDAAAGAAAKPKAGS